VRVTTVATTEILGRIPRVRDARAYRTIQFSGCTCSLKPSGRGCGAGTCARAVRQAPRSRGPPCGAVAQLGERLLCKQEVTSSILVGSTSLDRRSARADRRLPRRARSSAG
jgi:hypothetical protein